MGHQDERKTMAEEKKDELAIPEDFQVPPGEDPFEDKDEDVPQVTEVLA